MAVIHPYTGEYLTVHHMQPVSKKGKKKDPRNRVMMWWDKHQAWHRMFGNKNFLVVINTLVYETEFPKCKSRDWITLFGDMTPREAALLLARVWNIKRGIRCK